MAYKIKWTSAARENYSALISYLYDYWGFEVSEKFTEKLQRQLSLLEEHPFIGRQHDELSAVHRLVFEKHHTIFYTVFEDIVLILNVKDNRTSK